MNIFVKIRAVERQGALKIVKESLEYLINIARKNG